MAQLATDSLRPGSPAWVAPVDLEWVKCVVKSITANRVTVTLPDGTERAFPSDEVERANKEAVREYADITQLTHLNEPSILELLVSRFLEDDIYTSAGPVLVAINPCRRIPELFSEELRRNYQDAKLEAKLPPHMYKVVATAYRSMEMDAANQALVVSGESGAGKTESTKMALDYFATMSGGTGISSAILQSNPILEAFGNAKTTRNPNSSRFGKLLQVYFSLNADGYSRHLNSAEIQTYLLEKSRVVGPGAGERNYHIFYMLLRGASAGEREAWQLPPPEQAAATFQYIRGGVQDAAGREDAADWAEMREAMTAIGLGGDVQQQLFSLLAGILWLGNVTFCSSDSDDSCTVDPSADSALAKAAALLGVGEGALRTALTSRVLQTGRDVIVKPLRAGEARVARDSLAKGVYSALFDWLVQAINRQLNPVKKLLDSDKFIAVLDIFGFEHFEVNSFEQLCINYANERLQQLFCHHLFQHEQAEYQREGLRWALHRYSDNAHLVALLDASTQPLGVLKLLDDQCTQRGGGSDQNLLESIRKEHALGGGGRGAQKGGLAIPSRPPGTFAVQHFAGPVAYSVEGMVGKNMDDLSLGLKQLMAGSSGSLLQQLGATLLEDSSRRRSVASTFGRQMNRLVDTLQRAQLHFVRCIKPNPALQPGCSDARMILDQIRCAGVVEVGRIFKEGYPTRTSISLFLKRFNRSLIGLDLPSHPPPPSPSPPSASTPPSSGAPPSTPTPTTAPAPAAARGQASAAPPAPAPSPAAAAAPAAGGGAPADQRAGADRVLQQRFGLEPGLHYALGLTKIFFRAGVLGGVEAEFQRLERLSLQVQGCASYWRDFARVQPVRRKFMELARGHRQWLAEQAQLRALEEERRSLEAQRAAATAASAAAAAAAAAERERQERERAEAEEEQRRTEAEEEKQRLERQQVQRMWQELAAEREATQKAEADAEAERAARKELETQADAEREARQKLEMEAAAAHQEMQRRLDAMDEEKAEWEEAERKLKEREGAVAAQLEAIRLKEEEVQRREEEARALQEREEALRVKEQEVEALLRVERERVAERVGAGGDLEVSQMVQLLGASRTRHDVEAGLQRGQAASAHHDSQDAAASEARTRLDAQVTSIVAAARFRSLLSKSSASSASIAEEIEGGEDDGPLPPLPPLFSTISLSDIPIFALPPSPSVPTPGAGLPESPSAAAQSPQQLRAAAEAAEAAEAQAAAEHKRRVDYKDLVAVMEAIEGGAAASHPLAGEVNQLIMDAIAGMATLDEDVVWVEGVKAGQMQASAVMQMGVVELRIGDKYQQLQQNVKERVKELRDELKKGGAGGQQLVDQLRSFERAFSSWCSKFQRAFSRARHARDTRVNPDGSRVASEPSISLGRRSRNPFKRFFSTAS